MVGAYTVIFFVVWLLVLGGIYQLYKEYYSDDDNLGEL